MRRLLLVRHAKSSWAYPELADHDRPLNKRGQRDASMMAHRLSQNETQIEAVISSTALRAMAIAQAIAEQLRCPSISASISPLLSPVISKAELYTFSSKSLLDALFQLPDHNQQLIVVGHNPAITDVANHLQEQWIENVPTSGIVAISTSAERWAQINSGNCQLDYFDYPKKPFSNTTNNGGPRIIGHMISNNED